MKIYLDLLPDQRKQEIKRKKTFHKIIREELFFLLPLLLFILILINIRYVLSLQMDTAQSLHASEQSQVKYKTLEAYEKKFKETNELDKLLIKARSSHLYWGKLFIILSENMPEGVYLTNLSSKNYDIFMVGRARTRESLVDLKGKLEADECLKNVNVPLSNLVVKNDIDFEINFTITEECLKNDE